MKKARHKKTHVLRCHLYEISGISKLAEAESKPVTAWSWGQEETGGTVLNGMGFALGVLKTFEN